MRWVILSLGLAVAGLALARIAFAPVFLAERTEPATAFLLGASLFTIAIAAVIRK
jgi:hypothetical protein